MPRYMIELPFSSDYCMRSMGKVQQRDVDFLPQVYWACGLKGSRGWAIVEAADMDSARDTVPESIREDVTVSEIKVLSPELIQAVQEGSIERAS